MSNHKRIFIVGHAGAGKFLLSEALAERLGWKLIDANPGLERYIGRSLSEIVGKQGEEVFHQCEAEIIAYYKGQENVVVLLEEAVVVSPENRRLLSTEFVVHVKVSTPVQLKRLPQGREPVLPISDLKGFLDKHHLERDPLYEEVAKLTINTDETVNVDDDVNKIIKVL